MQANNPIKSTSTLELNSRPGEDETNYRSSEEFKNDILSFIRPLLYSGEFHLIQSILESKIPNFFSKYKHFQLFLYKIEFFQNIWKNKTREELDLFYAEKINPLISKKSNFWETQSNLRFITENPDIMNTRIYQQIWKECCHLFTIGIELAVTEMVFPLNNRKRKCLRNCKCVECMQRDYYRNYCGKLETIDVDIMKSHFVDLNLNAEQSNKDDYNLTIRISLSDSSDDSEGKCNNNNNNNTNNTNNTNNINTTPLEPNTNTCDDCNLEHTNSITISTNSNINSSINSQKKPTRKSRRQNQNPEKLKLKQFQFRFTKRENIDKKIIRKFKKFIKHKIKKFHVEVCSIVKQHPFWYNFVSLNLMPPFKYDIEGTAFKSFNTNYMYWVFAHPCAWELYTLFIKESYNKLINHFRTKYSLNANDPQHQILENYISTAAVIFIKTPINSNTISTNSGSNLRPQQQNNDNDINTQMENSRYLFDTNPYTNGGDKQNYLNYNEESFFMDTFRNDSPRNGTVKNQDIFEELMNCEIDNYNNNKIGMKMDLDLREDDTQLKMFDLDDNNNDIFYTPLD